MLKDIEDSKRTNVAVHSLLKQKNPSHPSEDFSVNFLIISDNYWPSISSENMKYSEEITNYLQKYHEAYMILKKPRKLHFIHALGTCQLELSFRDGCRREFEVSTVQVRFPTFMEKMRFTIVSRRM
jgi:hypothetical protein